MQAIRKSTLPTCARNAPYGHAVARNGRFNKTLIMYLVNKNHEKRKNEPTML
jgi:hypothetical protein